MSWTKINPPIYYNGITWTKILYEDSKNQPIKLHINDNDSKEIIDITKCKWTADHEHLIFNAELTTNKRYICKVSFQDIHEMDKVIIDTRIETVQQGSHKEKTLIKYESAKNLYSIHNVKIFLSIAPFEYYTHTSVKTVVYNRNFFPDMKLLLVNDDYEFEHPGIDCHAAVLAHHCEYFKTLLFSKDYVDLKGLDKVTQIKGSDKVTQPMGSHKAIKPIKPGSTSSPILSDIKINSRDVINCSGNSRDVINYSCNSITNSSAKSRIGEVICDEKDRKITATIEVLPTLLPGSKPMSSKEKMQVVFCFLELMYDGFDFYNYEFDFYNYDDHSSFKLFLELNDDQICAIIELANRYLAYQIAVFIFDMIYVLRTNKECIKLDRSLNALKLLPIVSKLGYEFIKQKYMDLICSEISVHPSRFVDQVIGLIDYVGKSGIKGGDIENDVRDDIKSSTDKDIKCDSTKDVKCDSAKDVKYDSARDIKYDSAKDVNIKTSKLKLILNAIKTSRFKKAHYKWND